MKNVFLVLSLACFPIYFSELTHLGHCIQMIFTGLGGGGGVRFRQDELGYIKTHLDSFEVAIYF